MTCGLMALLQPAWPFVLLLAVLLGVGRRPAVTGGRVGGVSDLVPGHLAVQAFR